MKEKKSPVRTTLYLTEEQLEWLREKAHEDKTTMSELVRESVEDRKRGEHKPSQISKKKIFPRVGKKLTF